MISMPSYPASFANLAHRAKLLMVRLIPHFGSLQGVNMEIGDFSLEGATHKGWYPYRPA